MKSVPWRRLKPGDVVRVTWNDHWDWKKPLEKDLDILKPIPQISTGVIRHVTKEVVVLEYDHCRGEAESGGTIIGSCIVKAKVYGRVRE